MARDNTLTLQRNEAIKLTFTKLSKGKGAKWRTEEIVKEVAGIFYLKPKTVYNILSAS